MTKDELRELANKKRQNKEQFSTRVDPSSIESLRLASLILNLPQSRTCELAFELILREAQSIGEK